MTDTDLRQIFGQDAVIIDLKQCEAKSVKTLKRTRRIRTIDRLRETDEVWNDVRNNWFPVGPSLVGKDLGNFDETYIFRRIVETETSE